MIPKNTFENLMYISYAYYYFFFSGYLNLNLLKRDEMHSLEQRGCFNEEEIYAWDNDASLFEYQGVWKFRG